MQIGHRLVGRSHPPLVIAEMSANHNGSLERALAVVAAAAAHGADAIKLQTYTPDTLTIDSHRAEFFIDDPGGLWHGRRLWDLYREAHTPWEWHRPIFEAARDAGLLCLSTAFDNTSLEFLVELGIDAVKIASFELVHVPLIDAAARTGLPLLISTGMATLPEIDAAVDVVQHAGARDLVLLKCTSAYPATEDDVHAATVADLRHRYGCEVGFSDHTLQPFAAYAAVGQGAVVVEKHVTLSRAAGGPDAAFSLEPHELRTITDGIQLVWRSLGEVRYGPVERERASVAERPSIYVVRRVLQGARLTAADLRVIRPAAGLRPAEWRRVIGRQARTAIEPGTPLSWDLLADEPAAPEPPPVNGPESSA